MDVRTEGRRWVPGRQTLIRTGTGAGERRDLPPAEAQEPQEVRPYDPVYDWFDLRRPEAPEPRQPGPV